MFERQLLIIEFAEPLEVRQIICLNEKWCSGCSWKVWFSSRLRAESNISMSASNPNMAKPTPTSHDHGVVNLIPELEISWFCPLKEPEVCKVTLNRTRTPPATTRVLWIYFFVFNLPIDIPCISFFIDHSAHSLLSKNFNCKIFFSLKFEYSEKATKFEEIFHLKIDVIE